MTDERRRHQAVALKYRRGTDAAPRLVAKGGGPTADRIIQIARAHGVLIREDAALVEILSTLDLYQDIPPPLYRAVAEILAFVYRLNKRALE
jgi:flagellar biosynthesis protein